MKKGLLFLMVVAFCSFASYGQVVSTMVSSTYGLTADTVTSTAAKYLVSPRAISGIVKQVAIVVTATEISGTSAGTASLEASIDGTNYYSASSTTFTITDVTTAQPFGWTLTDAPARYYRVKVVGVSTPSVRITAKQLVIK